MQFAKVIIEVVTKDVLTYFELNLDHKQQQYSEIIESGFFF